MITFARPLKNAEQYFIVLLFGKVKKKTESDFSYFVN